MSDLKRLQTEAELRWREVLVARRKAVKAEETYKEALRKWYEEGGVNAIPTSEDSSK